MRRPLNDMLWLLPVALALTGLHAFGTGATDVAIVVMIMAIAVLLAAGIWLRAIARRRLFLAGGLQPGSPWSRRLRGGLWFALLALAMALPLAAILVVSSVRPSGAYFLVVLILNIPVFVLLWHLWSRVLAPHAVPRFRPVLALRAALVVNFLLLFLVLSAVALLQSYPDFHGLTLGQAILSEVGRQEAESQLLTSLMQLAAAKDALAWWLGQQLLPPAVESNLVASGLRLSAWAVLLGTDALVVWSYLLVCSSVLTLVHWREWHPGMR